MNVSISRKRFHRIHDYGGIESPMNWRPVLLAQFYFCKNLEFTSEFFQRRRGVNQDAQFNFNFLFCIYSMKAPSQPMQVNFIVKYILHLGGKRITLCLTPFQGCGSGCWIGQVAWPLHSKNPLVVFGRKGLNFGRYSHKILVKMFPFLLEDGLYIKGSWMYFVACAHG